jgi:hypothetical protein
MDVPNILRKVTFKQKNNLNLRIVQLNKIQDNNSQILLFQMKNVLSRKNFLVLISINILWNYSNNSQKLFTNKGILIYN